MLRNGVRYLLARLPYRPAFRQTQVSPPFPTAGFDPTAVYIASDRRRFYRAIGIFCIFQASGWGFFTAYVARKSEVNWDTLVADVDWLNRRIAQRLESLTPSVLKQLILRPRPRQEKAESKPGVTSAAGAAADVVTPNAETSADKNDDEKSKGESYFGQSLVSTAKDVSSSFRLSLGLSEDKKTVKLSTTSLLPLLTGFMCVFTLFMGGVIPRRVVRRIGVVSRNACTSAPTKAKQTEEPILSVSTYGYFGLFPREPTFQVPFSQVRSTAPYKEGNKFINITITQRVFTFYVEKYQAEYMLPEFFDHLDQTATDLMPLKKK